MLASELESVMSAWVRRFSIKIFVFVVFLSSVSVRSKVLLYPVCPLLVVT